VNDFNALMLGFVTEALMSRSPISQAEVASFLRDMRRTPSGTLMTSKLLAERMQCESEAQAIQAFEVRY